MFRQVFSGFLDGLTSHVKEESPVADQAELSPRKQRRAHVETLTPMVGEFLLSTQNKEMAVNKQARQIQKEAKRRAKAMALALRGERERRWPYVVAAFAAGTTIGVLAGFAIARREELWNRLLSSKDQMQEKLSDAAETIRDKAGDMKEKAGDVIEDTKARARSASNNLRETAKV